MREREREQERMREENLLEEDRSDCVRGNLTRVDGVMSRW